LEEIGDDEEIPICQPQFTRTFKINESQGIRFDDVINVNHPGKEEVFAFK
jgi:hypothetical protein